MKNLVHVAAGSIAMVLVGLFWTATVVSELFLDRSAIVAVKHAIVIGLFILVPCLALTGASGLALSKVRALPVSRKKKRMGLLAANGIFLMVPMALFLDLKAGSGDFDSVFYGVQVAELTVGGIQLVLMALNFRDGLAIARGRRESMRAQDSKEHQAHALP